MDIEPRLKSSTIRFTLWPKTNYVNARIFRWYYVYCRHWFLAGLELRPIIALYSESQDSVLDRMLELDYVAIFVSIKSLR